MSTNLMNYLQLSPVFHIIFKCHVIASSEPVILYQPDLLIRIISLVRIQVFGLAIFNHFLHNNAD